MARQPRISLPDEASQDEVYADEFNDDEMRQAEVGTLFAIQGPQFQDVSWAIYRYKTRAELV